MSSLRRNHRQMIVVDLGRGSIKLAAAESAGEAVRFQQITTIDLPQEGEASYPADDATLSSLVRQAVDRNGWTGMEAACLLSREATSTQSIILPSMPEADLRQAIELTLAETLHFSLEGACFGYRTLRRFDKDGSSMLLMLVAVAQRPTVLRALRLLRDAGLRPVAVSSAAEALANLAYHARLCFDGEATIHVDIGDNSTILNLFENRLLRFSREIDSSRNSFTQALTRPILTDRGPVQLTRSQAEEVAETAGCPREDEDLPWPHGVRSSQILPLLEPVIQRLSSEIDRSVEYMRSLIDGAPIKRIILSGSSSRMRNLAPLLSENLDLPVTLIDPIARACAHWRLSIRDSGDVDTTTFSAILGYSIGNQQPINLLPRDEKVRLVVDKVARVRRVVAPFAVAGAACVALAAVPILGHYESATASMRWALDELSARHEVSEHNSQRQVEALTISGLLTEAQGPSAYWLGFMKELSTIIPEAMQLTSLVANQQDEAMVIRFNAKVHNGRVPFEVTVTDLTVALGDSPFLTNAHIVSATASDDETEGHVEAVLIARDVRIDASGEAP